MEIISVNIVAKFVSEAVVAEIIYNQSQNMSITATEITF